MKFQRPNHVYDCAPDILGNRDLPPEEQFTIGLRVVPMPEQDLYRRQVGEIQATYTPDEAASLCEALTKKMVGDRVEHIRGYEFEGGGEIADWETFYAEALPEVVAWVIRAVMSGAVLSEAERKN